MDGDVCMYDSVGIVVAVHLMRGAYAVCDGRWSGTGVGDAAVYR
jgi:hypothetical protein